MTRKTFDAGKTIEAHSAAKARIPKGVTRSVVHATFHMERTYNASPARVWKALTNPSAKAQWFGAPSEAVEIIERTMDVRPGGRERLKGRWGGRVVSSYDADLLRCDRARTAGLLLRDAFGRSEDFRFRRDHTAEGRWTFDPVPTY